MTEGFARKGFDGDLADGKLREDAFGRILLEGRELWEHKRDYKCVQTGNLAVEYETRESGLAGARRWNSGIATTTAYWYVIEFAPNRRLLIPTADLKALARRAITEGLHKWCGDHDRFHNALIPFGWVRDCELPIAQRDAA